MKEYTMSNFIPLFTMVLKKFWSARLFLSSYFSDFLWKSHRLWMICQGWFCDQSMKNRDNGHVINFPLFVMVFGKGFFIISTILELKDTRNKHISVIFVKIT